MSDGSGTQLRSKSDKNPKKGKSFLGNLIGRSDSDSPNISSKKSKKASETNETPSADASGVENMEDIEESMSSKDEESSDSATLLKMVWTTYIDSLKNNNINSIYAASVMLCFGRSPDQLKEEFKFSDQEVSRMLEVVSEGNFPIYKEFRESVYKTALNSTTFNQISEKGKFFLIDDNHPQKKISSAWENPLVEKSPLLLELEGKRNLCRNLIKMATEKQSLREKLLEKKTSEGSTDLSGISNLRFMIKIGGEELEDFNKELKKIEEEIAMQLSKEILPKSEKSESRKVPKNPLMGHFLILPESNKIVIPRNDSSAEISMLSKMTFQFFESIQNLGDLALYLNKRKSEDALQYEFVQTEEKDLPKSEASLLADLYRSLFYIISEKYLLSSTEVPDSELRFLNYIAKIAYVATGLEKKGVQRSKLQVKHLYVREIFAEVNKLLQSDLARSILDKTCAFLHRFMKNLETKFFDSLSKIIRSRKNINFPILKEEEIKSLINVSSIRFYKKYVLEAEWRLVLSYFSPQNEIQLENSCVSQISQRDLRGIIRVRKHNLSYSSHNFEKVKAFLDLRSKDIKVLYPPVPKREGRGGNPPRLEDILSRKSSEEKISLLDPLGLVLASRGYNSVDRPFKTESKINLRTRKILVGTESVQTLYDIITIRISGRDKERLKVDSYESFYQVLSDCASQAEKVISDAGLVT